MRIVRQRAPERFTVVDNDLLEDDRLSFRALGVLTHLLHLPDGWETDSNKLAEGEGREGRDAIRSALNEIESAGYIARRKVQDAATGRWATLMVLKDMPTPDYPASGVRRLENRQSGNQALLESTNTKNSPPPTPSGEEELDPATLAALDVDDLIVEARAIRRDQRLPEALWTARAVRRAIAAAVAAGRPVDLIGDALRIVATDGETRQPGRLPHDGPWWHLAEQTRLRRQKHTRAAAAREALIDARARQQAACTRCDADGMLRNFRGRLVRCDHQSDEETA